MKRTRVSIRGKRVVKDAEPEMTDEEYQEALKAYNSKVEDRFSDDFIGEIKKADD